MESLVAFLENHDRIPRELISNIHKRNIKVNFWKNPWCSSWRLRSNGQEESLEDYLEKSMVDILVEFRMHPLFIFWKNLL